ncbi:MAG TPA: hypothetical protein VI876_08995 [Dehalococcoidia bacterium]|nr:hypothetical protein [Dehalococcoidia bacterium]
MTNGRNSGGIWLRDWSAVAAARAARWGGRVSPGLGRIARQARPTLRLFGAGRKPGPSMATTLPRAPLVLRTKRPERPIGAPMLTVQSDVAYYPDDASEAEAVQHPSAPAAAAAVLRHAEPVTLPQAERRTEPRSVAARISRAVQQVLRRPSQPAAAPAAAEVARNEFTPRSASPEPETQPEAQEPGAQVASDVSPERLIASSAARDADGPPEPEMTLLRHAEAPQGPAPEEVPETEAGFEEESPPEAITVERPQAAEASGGGLLMSLRRVFRPESQETVEPPSSAPRARESAPSPSPAAPSISRAISIEDEAPSVTPQPLAAEPALTAEGTPEVLPEPDVTDVAPALQRSPAPQQQGSGLLFTLRRLVRPEPPAESAPGLAKAVETAEPANPTPVQERPATPQTVAETPGALASAVPELAQYSEETAAPFAAEAAPFRSTESPEMTLLRPETGRGEAAEPAPRQAAESQPFAESTGASPVAPIARAVEGGSRLPRILRLWRRPEEPGPELNLTLARQPSPASPAAPPPATSGNRRSTYNVETGRMETAEALSTADPGVGAASLSVSRTGALEAAPAVLRSARAMQGPVAARAEATLVYRARAAAEGVSSEGEAVAADGLSTLQLSPEAVARARRGDSPAAPMTIARADAPPAPGGGGGAATPSEGEAPAPEATGPSASPITPEADANKQITLETLARQVYDRLRARLLLERERSGIGAGMVSR